MICEYAGKLFAYSARILNIIINSDAYVDILESKLFLIQEICFPIIISAFMKITATNQKFKPNFYRNKTHEFKKSMLVILV